MPIDPSSSLTTIHPAQSQAPVPGRAGPQSRRASDEPFPGSAPRSSVATNTVVRMWRYKLMIVLIALAIIVPGAALVIYTHKPAFRAAGEICVSPVIPRLVYRLDDNGPIPAYQQFLNTQVAIVRCPTVLNAVLNLPDVQKTEWYSQRQTTLFGSELTNLERFKDSLDVQPRGNTQVIDVTFSCGDPHDSATLVNAVLDQYRLYVEETNRKERDALLGPIQDQYDTLKSSIQESEQGEEQLRVTLDAGAPDEIYKQRSAELAQLEARRDEVSRQIKLAEFQVQDMELAEAASPNVPAPASQVASAAPVRYQYDTEWRRLYQEFHDAQNAVDTARAWGLTNGNPRMVALLKTLSIKDELMRSRQEQLDEPSTATQHHAADPMRPNALAILDPRVRLTQLRREAATLTSDILSKREQLSETGELVRLLHRGDENLRHKREMFQEVHKVKLQREFERNAPDSIRIQTLAFPPTLPSNGNRRLMFVTLVCVAGVAAGCAAAYLRAMFTHVISDGQEAVAESQSPFLGMIPCIPEQDGGVEKDAWEQESIRVIRTLLIERLKRTAGGAVVSITSAGPGVGKTMLAISLAKSLASTGRRVLLVDADFRRPALASRMGLSPGVGLIRALRTGSDSVDKALLRTSDWLDVLPAGMPIEHRSDSELLADGRLKPLIDRWRRTYDLVVFDTSPVLAAADAAIVSQQTDGTVFAMREGRCLRPEVVEAVSNLRQSGGNLIGTVVLGSQSRRRYGYQYYYTDSIIVDSGPALDARDTQKAR